MQYVASIRTFALMTVAALVAACIFAAPAAAVDLATAPATPGQVEQLNELVEQVFGGIPEPGTRAAPGLVEKVQQKGRVPVIVRLRDADLPYGFFEDQTAPRTAVIRGLQRAVVDDVLSRTGGDEDALHVSRFKFLPAMALSADEETLDALLDSPNVIDIAEDVPVPPTLMDSVPLIGADPDESFAGYTGDGWTVAILDTGVDKTHPFLSGKVVSEACYSKAGGAGSGTSLCPGGVYESTAVGSGVPCTISQCNHGTHVAGIAAGSGVSFSGVAQDANIIAIQVFTNNNGSPGSYTTDQIKALERVYALRNTYQIASANMSLGGGTYTAPCDTDYWNALLKAEIDTLRTADIATVISSGNDYATNAISSPGCISTAVSVGSTTKSDVVSLFSNSAYFLSLLAPGSSIYSSLPGTGYGYMSGTSMAAPHVTGAWAVLKQAAPDASVAEILTALQDTGVPVADTRTGAGNRVKPRIDLAEALSVFRGTMVLDKVKVKEGKTRGADSMQFSGYLDATEADLTAAIGGLVTVTVSAAYVPDPDATTFTLPVEAEFISKGKYKSPKLATLPQLSLQIDTNKGTIKFSAKNADLTGLICPITVEIKFDAYAAVTQLGEDVVNGTNKPCPLPLLMGVMDSLEVLKDKAKKGKTPGTDSLMVSGMFTTGGPINTSQPVVITLGPDMFTVPGALFEEKSGKYSCKSADSGNGLVTAKFDTLKCKYTIKIKNAAITGSGTVAFGISVFGNPLTGGTITLPPEF